MRRETRTRTLLTMLGLCSCLCASAKSDTLHISIDQALEIALAENPTIRIADQEIERKDYVKKEKQAALIPALNASGSYQRNFKNQVMAMSMTDPSTGKESEMVIQMGFPNTYNGGLNLALPVIAPTLWQNIKLTQVDIERAVEAARTSRLNLVSQVKSAYYDAMLSKDSYEVLKKNYDQQVENARVIKASYQQGVASEYDLLRSEVAVRNQEPALLQAEKAVELSHLKLKVLIGVDLDMKLGVEGRLSDFEDELQNEIIDDQFSLNNSPNLRQLDYEIKYQQRNFKLLRSQRLPSINATGTLGVMTLSKDFDVMNYNWRGFSSAGLSLSIPLFEGFAKNHREKQVKIALENLKLQREDTERNLTLAVRNENESIKKARKQVFSNKEGLEMARKGYLIAQKRYEVGSGSFLELNDADLAWVQSELSYHQALHDYVVAKAQLENLLGSYPIK